MTSKFKLEDERMAEHFSSKKALKLHVFYLSDDCSSDKECSEVSRK